MTRALLSAACHAYAVAGVAYLVHLLRMKGRASVVGVLSLAVGWCLHLAALVARAQELPARPFDGVGDGLSALAALLVLGYLGLDRVYRLPALGAFVTPLALTVTMTALLVPEGPATAAGVLGAPGLYAHVLVAFAAFALFALASGAAVLYLVQERQVKGKRFGFAFSRLPSLEVLDELNRRLVLFGFAALSVTIASGALFAKSSWGAYWSWEPKQVLSLLAWLIFGALIAARRSGGWRGKRVALLTMLGLGVLLGSWVGLAAFPAGRHGERVSAMVGGARG